MTGILQLLRVGARRDRWQLLIWIAGVWLLTVGSANAAAAEFGGAKQRTALILLATQNPALLAIRGAPQGIEVGSVLFFELFTFLAVMAGLMSTFLVVRHTRSDEELGRAELVGAAPVIRIAALAAAVLLALVADALLAAGVAAGFAMTGADAAGSIVTGLAVGAVGASFAGVAALAAQLARTSRAANSIAGSTVGIAFLLRAVGDATGTPSTDGLSLTSAWPTWLSPIGWGEQTHAFAGSTMAPLILDLVLAALLILGALAIRLRRDIGASLLGERGGRERAATALRSSLGLAWRLHWPTVCGWAVGGAVLGLFTGSLSTVVATAVRGNASLTTAVRSIVPGSQGGDIQNVFIAAMLAFAGFLAAAAAVQAIMRMRSEESAGRAEPVFAAPVRRGAWVAHYLLVAASSAAAVAITAGLVAGAILLATGAPAGRFQGSVEAALAQLPAAFFYAGLVAAVFAVLPRLTVPLGWGLLGAGLTIGQFGGLLRLASWLRELSPFTHTPAVPVAAFDWSAALVLAGLGVALAALSVVMVRRRDLAS